MFNILIIIIILLCAVSIFFPKYDNNARNIEGLSNISSVKKTKKATSEEINKDAVKKGATPENTINILMDPTFKDVKFMSNDVDFVYADGQKTGLEKCLEQCVGSCVDYGFSGNSFCFPRL